MKRRTHNKSRHGCRNCKKRHVKVSNSKSTQPSLIYELTNPSFSAMNKALLAQTAQPVVSKAAHTSQIPPLSYPQQRPVDVLSWS